MVDREPFALTPHELARLRNVVMPHIEKRQELERELEKTKVVFSNILTAYLTGRNLEGTWNINFETGEMKPLVEHVGLATEAKLDPALAAAMSGDAQFPAQSADQTGGANVSHQ